MLVGLQLDDALLEQQRQAYAVKGVDESEPAQQPKKKRKQVYTNGEDVSETYLILVGWYNWRINQADTSSLVS